MLDTHTHLGTKIAPGVSWNRVCTEPGGTGFRYKIRWSQKITRKAFFKKQNVLCGGHVLTSVVYKYRVTIKEIDTFDVM